MKTSSQCLSRLTQLLGATMVLFSAWAQTDGVQLTLRGAWPKIFPQYGGEAVTVVGHYAYCSGITLHGGGGQLIVLDLTDPVRPQFKGHCLYSLPADPVPVSRLELPVGPIDIAIADHYAYVACAHGAPVLPDLAGGLVIIDLSDPTSPVPIGHHAATAGSYAIRVCVEGNKAYLGLGKEPARLEIVDISDPAAPSLIGGGDTGPNRVQALDVVGERAFVGDGRGGMEIYDVQDPLNPVRLGGTPAAQVLAVTVSDHYAYTLYNPGSTTRRGFTVFDVSNPAAPRLLGACDKGIISGSLSGSVHLAGRYAYATYGAGYLLVMDVGSPASPTLAGRYEFYLSAGDFSVADGRAYVAAASFDNSLRILDVRDPAHPGELGRYTAADTASIQSAHMVGGLGCVTFASPNRWELLDVSNPGDPKLLHRRATTTENRKARIVGNTLCLLQYSGATSRGQLQLFDITRPSSPLLQATCVFTNAECAPTDLDIAGPYAYVADEWNGLIVVDVSVPTAPRQVATVPAANALAVQVAGGYAYLGRRQVWDDDDGCYYARLQILDVSNPAKPVKIAAYNAASDRVLKDLFVDGSRAFLSLSGGATPGQLQVVDVSIPSSPRLLTSHPTQAPGPRALQVVEDTVYVAEDTWGLSIFGLTQPSPLKLNPPILSTTTLTLSWSGGPGIKLQQTTSLTNPNWQDVAGSEGVSSIEVARDAAAAFFRLIQP